MKSIFSILGYIPKRRVRTLIANHELQLNLHILSAEFGHAYGKELQNRRKMYHEDIIEELKPLLNE